MQAEQTVQNYMQLSDTARKNTSALIKAVTVASDSVKLLSRAKGNDSLMMKYKQKKDQLMQKFNLNDSLGKATSQKVDSVLSVLSLSGIPIGYSRASAPLSWFYKKHRRYNTAQAGYPSLATYNYQRDAGYGWGYIKYLLGIIISGFSLSFGAPFWFEALVKISNIRRSGIKPKINNN